MDSAIVCAYGESMDSMSSAVGIEVISHILLN